MAPPSLWLRFTMTAAKSETEPVSESEVEVAEVPETDSSLGFGHGLSIFGHRLLSLDVMQFVALIVAAAFGLYELTLNRIDRRIDTSLAFAERFTEGEVGEQRRALDRAWYKHAEEVAALQELAVQQPNGGLPMFQAYFAREILASVPPDLSAGGVTDTNVGAQPIPNIDLLLAIGEIADTLDQLALCVKPSCDSWWCGTHARCHGPTAREHFCQYALSFTSLYAPVLAEIKEDLGTPALGAAAQDFATSEECQEWIGSSSSEAQ